jgi:hypothetical protein
MYHVVVVPSFTTGILVNLKQVRTPPTSSGTIEPMRLTAWLERTALVDAYLFRKKDSFLMYV